LAFQTLEEWSAVLDATPQPRPIAVAFFSTNALKRFLAEAMAQCEADVFSPSRAEVENENWGLPDSVKMAAGGAK
jgi:hypothetical protein